MCAIIERNVSAKVCMGYRRPNGVDRCRACAIRAPRYVRYLFLGHCAKIVDVSSDVLQQLTLFAEFSAAAYCANNIDSTGDKLTCSTGNCPAVEAASTTTLYEFEEYVTTR